MEIEEKRMVMIKTRVEEGLDNVSPVWYLSHPAYSPTVSLYTTILNYHQTHSCTVFVWTRKTDEFSRDLFPQKLWRKSKFEKLDDWEQKWVEQKERKERKENNKISPILPALLPAGQ